MDGICLPGHRLLPGFAAISAGHAVPHGQRPASASRSVRATAIPLARSVRGALRRSEIVALNIGDVELIDGRGVVLTVRRSKTPTTPGQGRRSRSGAPTTPTWCAPTALRRWLDHRAARHADDPLFIGLRAGAVMTAAWLSDKAVVRLVKDTAEAVGDGDPGADGKDLFGNFAVGVQRSYSGHSLRAGFATAAAEAEAQLHDVMRTDSATVGRGCPPLHALRRSVAQQRHREGHAPSTVRAGGAVRPPKQS